jgi:dolichol-phosphate mannosyltransferase
VRIIRAVAEVLADLPLRIVVVDDQSPDGTAQLVRDTFANDDRVKVIERTRERGLATAIRDGMLEADDVILVMDTDFNHDPADAPRLIAALDRVDVAAGSRFVPGGSMPMWQRYMLSYIYNLGIRVLFLSRHTDHLSGYFAIRRSAFDRIDKAKVFWGFGDYYMRLLILASREGVVVGEVPVRYGNRFSGESKTDFFSIFAGYSREVLKLFVLRMRGKW